MTAGDGTHNADSWAQWWASARSVAHRSARQAPERIPQWFIRQVARLRNRVPRVMVILIVAALLGSVYSASPDGSGTLGPVISWLWVIAIVDIGVGAAGALWRAVRR